MKRPCTTSRVFKRDLITLIVDLFVELELAWARIGFVAAVRIDADGGGDIDYILISILSRV